MAFYQRKPDIIIRNGTIVDGTGAKPYVANLCIEGGKIAAIYYDLLKDTAQVDIMPALGTHFAMTEAEWNAFIGPQVPFKDMIVHNWRTDVEKIGEIPAEEVKEISGGLWTEPVAVEVKGCTLEENGLQFQYGENIITWYSLLFFNDR